MLVVVVVVVLLVELVCCGDGGDCVGDGVGSRGATCLRRGEDIDSSRPPLASRLWLVALRETYWKLSGMFAWSVFPCPY